MKQRRRQPTPEQQAPVEWFCRQVAKRRLATPGVIALEMSRPLNFLASQLMHFFSPAVWAIARWGLSHIDGTEMRVTAPEPAS